MFRNNFEKFDFYLLQDVGFCIGNIFQIFLINVTKTKVEGICILRPIGMVFGIFFY